MYIWFFFTFELSFVLLGTGYPEISQRWRLWKSSPSDSFHTVLDGSRFEDPTGLNSSEWVVVIGWKTPASHRRSSWTLDPTNFDRLRFFVVCNSCYSLTKPAILVRLIQLEGFESHWLLSDLFGGWYLTTIQPCRCRFSWSMYVCTSLYGCLNLKQSWVDQSYDDGWRCRFWWFVFSKKKKKTRFGLFAPVSSEMEKTWYSQIENQS